MRRLLRGGGLRALALAPGVLSFASCQGGAARETADSAGAGGFAASAAPGAPARRRAAHAPAASAGAGRAAGAASSGATDSPPSKQRTRAPPSAQPAASMSTLVVGATGHVGRQTVAALLARGMPVRALVRLGSDAAALEAAGAVVVRGDLMQPATLEAACAGVDAVVLCAAGFMCRRPGDGHETDSVGNRAVVDAALRHGVRRIVLLSQLRCDAAPRVPQLAAKAALEAYCRARGAPFVALRPGVFLDQGTDQLAELIRKRSIYALTGDARTATCYVFTPDLADNLAAAVTLDASWDGASIEIGWDRAVSTEQLAALLSEQLGERVSIDAAGGGFLRGVALPLAAWFSNAAADMREMLAVLGAGDYVADTALQAKAFGHVPTAEDALRRYLLSRGLLPAAA